MFTFKQNITKLCGIVHALIKIIDLYFNQEKNAISLVAIPLHFHVIFTIITKDYKCSSTQAINFKWSITKTRL